MCLFLSHYIMGGSGDDVKRLVGCGGVGGVVEREEEKRAKRIKKERKISKRRRGRAETKRNEKNTVYSSAQLRSDEVGYGAEESFDTIIRTTIHNLPSIFFPFRRICGERERWRKREREGGMGGMS